MLNFLNLFKSQYKFSKYSDNFFFGTAISTKNLQYLKENKINTIVSLLPDTEMPKSTFSEIASESKKLNYIASMSHFLLVKLLKLIFKKQKTL